MIRIEDRPRTRRGPGQLARLANISGSQEAPCRRAITAIRLAALIMVTRQTSAALWLSSLRSRTQALVRGPKPVVVVAEQAGTKQIAQI